MPFDPSEASEKIPSEIHLHHAADIPGGNPDEEEGDSKDGKNRRARTFRGSEEVS